MVVMPYQFMIIAVISIFTIIGVGLFIYLFLIPCPNFGNYFKKRNWKRKTSCLNPSVDTTTGKKLSNMPVNMLQCPHGCCIGIPVPSEDSQNNNKDPSQVEKRSSITGPQGHGFYTSGPWKIDTLGADAFGQFSNSEFLMTEYFASMMSPQQAPIEVTEPTIEPDVEPGLHCHIVGGGSLMICDDADDHSNDYALMDMSSQSDADMAMMIF